MNKKFVRSVSLVAVAIGLSASLAACGDAVEPDVMALKYTGGSTEGAKFDKCVMPTEIADATFNDTHQYVMVSERTWNISNSDIADSKTPIEAATKPEPPRAPGEASRPGAKVHVWLKADFFLNTNCSDPDGDGPLEAKDSPVVKWWELLGRRYGADVDPGVDPAEQSKDEGWRNMLINNLVPSEQRAIQDSARAFTADELDTGANDSWAKIETEIETRLSKDLNANGSFFCGPGFDRNNPTVCPPIRVTITDIGYADKAVSDARAKLTAAELEAERARVEAESKVKVANTLAGAARNPAYLEFEKLQTAMDIELQRTRQVELCAANPNCTIILGEGTAIVGGK